MPNFDYGNDVETAVMDALPHAIHPMHNDWRAKADALIAGLRIRGFKIIPIEEEEPEE
jgi:hypothetical protein